MAGQVPPPYGGQNIMIQTAVAQFAAWPECESVHLPFFFTSDLQTARTVGWGKLIELVRVIGRLLRIRLGGAIDVLLYPSGGPQTVPIIRDILLLPWMLLFAKRVIVHFHAAGIADRLPLERPSMLRTMLAALYPQAFAAVVMTEFNRRDPAAFGIWRVIVRPHKIPDEFDPSIAPKHVSSAGKRLLYVGHLHPDKGTDALLRAFAALRANNAELSLELVGECLPPWSRAELDGQIEELGIGTDVTLSGVLTGRAKAEAFAQADLFVFPTIAPYESFGLVMIEAMMWSLPIVASDWRGNAEVLTAAPEGLLFPVSAPLDRNLQSALEHAMERQEQWREWGKINRATFERQYREQPGELWLARPVLASVRAEGP